MGRKKSVIPGFSLNRALGISSAKQKIARATGIPTTKQGRKRKMQSHRSQPRTTEECEQITETVATHRNIRKHVIRIAIALCIGLLVVLKIKSLLF